MRILLIDDDETNARFLQSVLTRPARGPTAIAVRRAGRLFEALRWLDSPEGRFDVILLDLGLPERGGSTTVKLVRAPGVPIVVVTAGAGPEVERDVREAGNVGYLVKGRGVAPALVRALASAAARHRATRPGAGRARRDVPPHRPRADWGPAGAPVRLARSPAPG